MNKIKNFIVALQQRHKNYVVKFSIFSPPPVFVQYKLHELLWNCIDEKKNWKNLFLYLWHIKRDFEEHFFILNGLMSRVKRRERKQKLQQWRHRIMNLISFMATTIVAKCSRTLVHWQTIRFHFFLLLMLMLM